MAPSARTFGAALLATAAASPFSLSELRAAVGGGVALRILPVGDSVTYGSDDQPNAYRSELASLLQKDGNKVEIVGTTLHGDWPHNSVEASSKIETTDELSMRVETAVPGFLPNLVILNVGAADCEGVGDATGVSERLLRIMEFTWDASLSASVVLSTSVLPEDAETKQCVSDMNDEIRNLVKEQTEISRKVVLVDLDGDEPIETDDEGFPTEDGYKTMAKLLFAGIDDAGTRGWLEKPEELPEDAPEPEEEGADGEEGDLLPSLTESASASESTTSQVAALPLSIPSGLGFAKRQEPVAKREDIPTSFSMPTSVDMPSGMSSFPTSEVAAAVSAFNDIVADADGMAAGAAATPTVSAEDAEELTDVTQDLMGELFGGEPVEKRANAPTPVTTPTSITLPSGVSTFPTSEVVAAVSAFKEIVPGMDELEDGATPTELMAGATPSVSAEDAEELQEVTQDLIGELFGGETVEKRADIPVSIPTPTTSMPSEVPTSQAAAAVSAFKETIPGLKEMEAGSNDVSASISTPVMSVPSEIPTSQVAEAVAAFQDLAGGFERRQEDGSTSSAMAVPTNIPTDPAAIISAVKGALPAGAGLDQIMPTGSLEELVSGDAEGLAVGGIERHQDGVFTPPLDGGDTSPSAPELPTDSAQILSAVKQAMPTGAGLPEGVAEKLTGHARRQAMTSTPPISIPTAIPTGAVEALIKGSKALQGREDLEDKLENALPNQVAEPVDEIGDAVEDALPSGVEDELENLEFDEEDFKEAGGLLKARGKSGKGSGGSSSGARGLAASAMAVVAAVGFSLAVL